MISVIITTYKRPTFLARAIKSVLNQNYKNVELIVVDDNNADTASRLETIALINSFSEKIDYIKLPKNAGACNARNIGLQKAIGEFVLFLDDDDELLPRHLELLYEQYKTNDAKLGVVFSQANIIDVKKNAVNKTNNVLKISDDSLLWHLLIGANSTSAILFKKEAVLKVGGWIQLPFGHENFLMVRIFAEGYKGVSIAEHSVNIFVEETERISNDKNRLNGLDVLFESIEPYTKKYSKKIQKQYKYKLMKSKVLLNIGRNYKSALINYYKLLQLDFFNLNNLKFLILLSFPFPMFLGRLNNLYRAFFPKTL